MDAYDRYDQLPDSYHDDDRWIEVERLRMEGRCAEAKGIVAEIRSDYKFEVAG